MKWFVRVGNWLVRVGNPIIALANLALQITIKAFGGGHPAYLILAFFFVANAIFWRSVA